MKYNAIQCYKVNKVVLKKVVTFWRSLLIFLKSAVAQWQTPILKNNVRIRIKTRHSTRKICFTGPVYVTASFYHKIILVFLFAQFSSKKQILQSLSNLFFQYFCKQYLSVQLALTEVFAVNSKLCSCSVLLQLAKQTNKDWHGSEIFSLEKILSAAFVGQCGKRHRCLSQSRRKV